MHDLPVTTLASTLKYHGYSITVARQAVFRALQQHEPQTITELTQRCSAIDRASVYRTVTLFEKVGVAQRLYIGWKYKLELTDAFTHHHHHLSCINCGKIVALPEDTIIERRLLSLAKAQGFQAQDHQIEIRGLCADCRQ